MAKNIYIHSADFRDRVKTFLPTPVELVDLQDKAEWWSGGSPGEVLVGFGEQSMHVSLFSVVWKGPHTPKVKGRRLFSLRYSMLPSSADEALEVVRLLLEASRRIRLASFTVCSHCQKSTPPEWMHSETICQGCAEKHLGVVY